MAEDLVRTEGFPAASRTDWQAMVAKILTRAGTEFPADAPEQALSSRTADGIEIAPLYAPAPPPGVPGLFPFTRGRTAAGNRAGWDIRALVQHPEPKAANAAALEDLAGGAASLWLTLGPAGTPVADLPAVLEEVLLDVCGIDLDAGPDSPVATEAFLALADERHVPPDQLRGCLGHDPIGVLARTGGQDDAPAQLSRLGTLAAGVAAEYPGLRTVTADALAFHDAGATEAQELGASLALGVAYLRALTTGGLDVEAALGQLQFRYAATADQFATIAKLRAARRAWARIAELSGATGAVAGQYQHVATSWPMMTRQDPWTNMLRATLACFAACAGGADAITAMPFDAALGLPDPLARRIARNTPLLLVEESHVAAVLDPAGGSGFVEALTGALAGRAWAVFTEIERAGGIVETLRTGWLAEQIAAAREARQTAIAAGEETILGVTAFPLEDERLLTRAGAPSPPGGGLPRIRWAEPLEAADA